VHTKAEALDYLEIYKAEVKNYLERKIKCLRLDRGGEYFPKFFLMYSVRNIGLFMRGRLSFHPNQTGLPRGKTAC